MAGLLVAIAAMGILMSMVMPSWRTFATREKEAELIFRGEQYMRAIELYQRRFAGAYPTDLEMLVEQRFLRQAYDDPMTGEPFEIVRQGSVGMTSAPAETPQTGRSATRVGQPGTGPDSSRTQLGSPAARLSTGADGSTSSPFTQAAAGLGEGAGGIIGVVSGSTDTSMKEYNGRNRYDEWLFIYLPQATQPGVGVGAPGAGQPGVGDTGAAGAGGFSGVRGVGGSTAQPGTEQSSPEGRRPGRQPRRGRR